MKYVGMTSRDPMIRKREWELKQKIYHFTIIKRFLSYDDALLLENTYRQMGYTSSPGGERKDGNIYSVYTFEYF